MEIVFFIQAMPTPFTQKNLIQDLLLKTTKNIFFLNYLIGNNQFMSCSLSFKSK